MALFVLAVMIVKAAVSGWWIGAIIAAVGLCAEFVASQALAVFARFLNRGARDPMRGVGSVVRRHPGRVSGDQARTRRRRLASAS